MDELLDLLARLKNEPIGGHRIKGDSVKMPEQGNMSKAIKTAALLLADGSWREATRVRAIARIYHVDYGTLLDECGIAVSDSGKYVCIEMESTPELPPDEE